MSGCCEFKPLCVTNFNGDKLIINLNDVEYISEYSYKDDAKKEAKCLIQMKSCKDPDRFWVKESYNDIIAKL